MAFTALATRVYKAPLTVQWGNSIKDNDDYFLTAASKGWINFNGCGTVSIKSSFNVASIVDNVSGSFSISWDTDFATATYAVAGICEMIGGNNVNVSINVSATAVMTSGIVSLKLANIANQIETDVGNISVIAMGVQA